jgi:anthranilate phosphoribosyltransferase
MKSYAEYLSLLAQETDADLTERDFALLTGAMLDAGVPDLELGALLGIFKARLDRVPLLLGLVDALDARIARWSTSVQCCPVSLACYGGTSDTADLTPLLGLMLACCPAQAGRPSIASCSRSPWPLCRMPCLHRGSRICCHSVPGWGHCHCWSARRD